MYQQRKSELNECMGSVVLVTHLELNQVGLRSSDAVDQTWLGVLKILGTRPAIGPASAKASKP